MYNFCISAEKMREKGGIRKMKQKKLTKWLAASLAAAMLVQASMPQYAVYAQELTAGSAETGMDTVTEDACRSFRMAQPLSRRDLTRRQ